MKRQSDRKNEGIEIYTFLGLIFILIFISIGVASIPASASTPLLSPSRVYNVAESNNELRKETVVNYPDLVVAKFISPSREDMNASVTIKNAGAGNATNFTVRFEVSEHEKLTDPIEEKQGYKQLKKEGAVNIRVHFKRLNARNGGWLEIKKLIRDEPGEPPEFELVKRYSGDIFSEWSPWVKGDSLWIFCNLKYDYIIDAWEWGEIVDTTINATLNASESVPVHIPPPWSDGKKYTPPQNLKVTVDPYNNITEQKEGNNNRTGVIYVDLEADNLEFVSPTESMLSVIVKTNKIRATIKNNNETDGIVFPAGGEKRNFNVALEIREPGNETPAFRHTENSNAKNSTVLFDFPHADRKLYAGEEMNVTFIEGKIYPDFEGYTKDYVVAVIADSENDIIEANEFYQEGENEDSNVTSETATVYHVSGYTGGDLDTVTQGRIYGDMIYSIGDSAYDSGNVSFNDINAQIPDNANITLARLYLYWLFWPEHVFADVDMHFNGEPVSRVRRYSDDTVATRYPSRYGTYVYDVTEGVKDVLANGGNYEASAEIYDADAHCTGMGLLIVYEDESKPLIEYGIAEGALVLMADNEEYPTGLLPEQCTANASFAGVVNKTSKAELLTVLPSWKIENLWTPGAVGDALLFNGQEVGTPRGKSYWRYKNDRCMALTLNHWEDVTVSTTQNKAEIQSRGNYMMATNAFFKVTYLPDLTVTSLAVTPSSPRGGDRCKIEATIHNLGEAKAENFRVQFTASDGNTEEPFRTVDLLGPNNKTTVNFTWTAPDKLEGFGQIQTKNVSITVTADPPPPAVEESDEDNNELTGYIRVRITEEPLTLSFDTGSPVNPYPSISGIHEGTILLNNTITVNKLYTYPCPGTGGHTEYVKIYTMNQEQ